MTPNHLARVETGWSRSNPTARPDRTPAMLAARLAARLVRKRGPVASGRAGNPDAGDPGDVGILATYGQADHGMLGE